MKDRQIIDAETGLPDPTPPPKEGREAECDLGAAELPLRSALDVRREMNRVYREVRSKRLAPEDGTKLTYILSSIGKMIETHEIERRLSELEAARLPAPR